MNIAYLLIGGNEGDRVENLAKACGNIAVSAGRILRRSALYETAPWGKPGQPDFLNQALEVETGLEAATLMDVLLGIEEKMGRRRTEKYGARIIDIDILFFNDAVIRTPHLTVPHPEVQNRRFALEPMDEIASCYIHPVTGQSIHDLLLACPDTLEVKKIQPNA
jgi:2-amino-4-hydroxy-6-hydroxymethyldihydropteridine diphosphokinase